MMKHTVQGPKIFISAVRNTVLWWSTLYRDQRYSYQQWETEWWNVVCSTGYVAIWH